MVVPQDTARCVQLNAHASERWSDNDCSLPLASVCKLRRTLYNTSAYTPPASIVVPPPTQEGGVTDAGAAQVEAAACAVVEIRGRAAAVEWTNVTGRYALENFVSSGRPVYR